MPPIAEKEQKHFVEEYCTITSGSLALNGKPILHDISLRFFPGENVLVTGHNGAGKTSLLRILSGELALSGGSLTWRQNRPRTVFLPDAPWTYDMLTVREHVHFFAKMWRKKIDVGAFLQEHQLQNHQDVYGIDLSLGLRQRLLFALACLGNPDVLLLDEPFNGLDGHSVSDFNSRIRALAARGCCIIIVSHRHDVVAKNCTRRISLSQGRIVSDDPVPDAQEISTYGIGETPT